MIHGRLDAKNQVMEQVLAEIIVGGIMAILKREIGKFLSKLFLMHSYQCKSTREEGTMDNVWQV